MKNNIAPKIIVSLLLWISFPILGLAQPASITGRVIDADSQIPIAFANILLLETGQGTTTSETGQFALTNIPPGYYRLQTSFIGYTTHVIDSVYLTPAMSQKITIPLAPQIEQLTEISVTPHAGIERFEPAIHSLSGQKLQQIPSNQDVMQAIQILPGISAPPGLTNELNIRGGASIENRFLVDGIEVPIINHFNTQGSSGGIRSLIPSHIVKKTSLHRSDLPIETGNAASSVLSFTLEDGSQEKPTINLTLGSTDATLLYRGRLQPQRQHSLIASLRQSYLSPTLRLLQRPVLSNYGDFYLKTTWYLSKNQLLSFISLGSYDTSQVNEDAPDTPSNQFAKAVASHRTHGYATTAVKYQSFHGENMTTLILSYDGIRQQLQKKNPDPNIFYQQRRYHATDSRASLRLEHRWHWASGSLTFGGNLSEHYHRARFTVDWRKDHFRSLDYYALLRYYRWSPYLQLTQSLTRRWHLKAGLRYEGSNYSPRTRGPFSPRLTSSIALSDHLHLHAHAALYPQMPANHSLALRDSTDRLVNHDLLRPFTARHLNLGLLWQMPASSLSRLTFDIFHKAYRHYPVSQYDGVALINKGNGFDLVGNEPLTSTGTGGAYGVELTAHFTPSNGFYSLVSYSLSWSRFYHAPTQRDLPSAVDTRHIVNLLIGKDFPGNWHIGLVGRLQSGRPYTPWDIENSSHITRWNESLSTGLPDYHRLNQKRLPTSCTLDIRIDKSITLKHARLKAILEISNLSCTGKESGRPVLITTRNPHGHATIAPNGHQYQLQQINSTLFLFVPSAAVMMEF
ncbi:MAG: TonB-dependent receptor [Chitinophagales bacterium]|nr:TonB-dependent receptor [Chitinophagales bacterium]